MSRDGENHGEGERSTTNSRIIGNGRQTSDIRHQPRREGRIKHKFHKERGIIIALITRRERGQTQGSAHTINGLRSLYHPHLSPLPSTGCYGTTCIIY